MTDSPLHDVQWNGSTAVARVQGEVDLHCSTDLQQDLLDLLDHNPRPTKLVIDLSGVPYMDSSGVASLVKLLSRTQKLGVDMVLAAPAPKVRSIMEITRLDSVFSIVETVQEA
jgi:anti-sigma B factor antagonist